MSTSGAPAAGFPTPGRGAWTQTGGLLPIRPGSTNRAGYFRDAKAGEKRVGSAWSTGADTSHHAHVVHLGVVAAQTLLDVPADGIWGPVTTRQAERFQRVARLTPDGIVGPTTMFQLLEGTIRHLAQLYEIPPSVIGGLVGNESNFDPAAVGVNGLDHGLAQINLGVHEVSVEQALDVSFALEWTSKDLRRTYDAWNGKAAAGVDLWDIAVANHNSPALARKWAQTGHAPEVPGRVFQIGEYVDAVFNHPAARALAA